MFSIKNVTDIALKLMRKYDLLQNGWSFSYNRQKRDCAECDVANKKVRLSYPVISINLEKEEFIINLIKHEIAHALTKIRCGNNVECHGEEWTRIHIEMGGDGNPYCPSKIKWPKYKYIYYCKKCKTKIKRDRKISDDKLYCKECGKKPGKGKTPQDYKLILL